MKPHQLFAALAARQQLKTLQLAKAMGRPKLQPQLHRFLKGEVASPAATTAQPLAAYFKLPLEAVYDEKKATEIAKALGITALPEQPPAVKKPKAVKSGGDFDADTQKVASTYAKMNPAERQRFRLLMLAAKDSINPTAIKPAPRDASTPVDRLLGDSGLSGLDEIPSKGAE